MPSVGTESWADRPWKRTQSHYAEALRRAWSVVWVEWWGPPSAQSGVCSSSPSESAQALPTPHCGLALDLGQTGPGRRCHRSSPNLSSWTTSTSVATIPQAPTPGNSTSQLYTGSGTNKTERYMTLGLLLSRRQTPTQVVQRSSVTAQTSSASAITSFGAGQALKGNRGGHSGLLLQQLRSPPYFRQGVPQQPRSRAASPAPQPAQTLDTVTPATRLSQG